MSRKLLWRWLLVLTVIGVSVYLMTSRSVRLGLDLRGGTQIVLEAEGDVAGDTIERTLEVLRQRVDQLGVAEPSLQQSGDNRVIVELPGVTDPEEALRVIGRTAQLAFHPVLGIDDSAVEGAEDEEAGQNDDQDPAENEAAQDGEEIVLQDEDGTPIRLGPAGLVGDAVGNAEAVLDPQFGATWQVTVTFRGQGGDQWADLTGEAACSPPGDPRRRIAIVLDESVISSPQVDPSIECDIGIAGGGDTVITGDFTQDEAKELALLIRAGALPVPVEVVERRTIGPTLGDAAIEASVEAAIIGGALTILYVIAYYRVLGLLAMIALLSYGVISYAVLLALGATLTLPGIAGFVLAIGMAVDANVLVFERTKEEFGAGRRMRAAVSQGFGKAWSAIADSNATTLLAAFILFFFAAGAVRGFGVTLAVGVIVSMFSAVVVTRILVETAMIGRKMVARPAWFGMGVGGKLRKRFEENPVDLMSRARIWFSLSVLAVLVALVGLFTQGLNFGLEFTGGRLLEFSSVQPVGIDELRSELAEAGFPRAVVQESGSGNITVRAGELSDSEERSITDAVTTLGGSADVVRDEFVGPTIGDELKRKALIALALGLGAQLIYLAVRFRWTYGVSAVIALFQNILLVVGAFAWLGKDLDGVFIAALLTVIGYSINDNVVIFDRIREQRRLRWKESLSKVANDACLQTVPRTINTGMGALFILVALYMLGGETLTDFAFALILGIIAGTYSSVFTASPLLVAFEKASGVTTAGTAPRPKSAKSSVRR